MSLVSKQNGNNGKFSRFKSVDDFNFIEEIGKGGYSVVHLVSHKVTGRRYALKVSHRYKKGKDRSDRAYTEIEVLKKLKHENIIQMKGWFEDDENIYLVLEYISGKDCSKFFKHKLPTKLQVITIMRQLVEALTYVHEEKIIHRDIKLENILIDSHFKVKLIDFGLCAILSEEYDFVTGLVGTVRYSSPEIISGKSYNSSTDIWGIGVILFMLLTGSYPFDGSKKESIFARIREKNIHYSKYNLEKKEVRLLKKLLEKDPEKRIEIEEILEDPFFN